jgi:large subunit ribosomal protein L22
MDMADHQQAERLEFSAKARNVRMSAQKAKLVLDTVRGRTVPEALALLGFINKRAAPYVAKLIRSAVANAEDHANRKGFNIDAETLVISELRVDGGPILKRWRARSRGMANLIQKKTCHFTVKVADPKWLEKERELHPSYQKRRQRVSKEDRLAKREAKKKAVKA